MLKRALSDVPGQGAWTFSIDGKGRQYSAIQGTSSSIVNSVTYNESDQPLVINLGLGDEDIYTYDQNTGRMTQYWFHIGTLPSITSGTLTWNPNGTLRQLYVNDAINNGLTQTCNYGTPSTPGYDELGRLVKVDCGATIWQQNFSFDPFNNLTKTVPTGGTGTSWMPGYDQNTNHELGSTYDSNGNLLTDTFHTYTWDQNNKVKSVVDAGITLTSDALGNVVEKSTSGVYTQVLYSPVGRTATMSGQTTTKWLLPMPGGVKAATGIQFWHADWLGTVRFASGKTGRNSVSDKAYAPYGEVYKAIVGGAVANSFTGDLQDIVAGTFDTPNRELNPTQGRWLSPDPSHSGWNAYAYPVNPLNTTDNSGLEDDPFGVIVDDAGLYSNIRFTANFYFNGGDSDCSGSTDCVAASEAMMNEDSPSSGRGVSLVAGGDEPLSPFAQQILGSPALQNAAGAVTALGNLGVGIGAGVFGGPMLGVYTFQQMGGTGLKFDPNTDRHPQVWLGMVHEHHLLPQAKEFEKFFKDANLDVEDFRVKLPVSVHILKPDGIHTGTGRGGDWNQAWRTFKLANPNPSRGEILNHLDKMIDDFELRPYVEANRAIDIIDEGPIE